MEQTVTQIEYAVGLTRDEYVRSQALVSHTLRRQVAGSRWISVIMLVLCIGMVGMEYRVTGVIEPAMAVILTLMIVAELWMMLDLPRQVRRQQQAAYDATLFSGHSFEGNVRVDEYGIEKHTGDETTRVEFARCEAYIEAEDMLLFCVFGGRSIVVPARCLTMEDAERTKQLAFEKILPAKRYILSPIAPKLERRLPMAPLLVEDDEAVLTVNVEYTANELKDNLTDSAMRGYVEKLPQKMLTAVFFAIVFYFGFAVMPLPLFLLSMVLQFVMDILFIRFRGRRAIATSNGDVCRLRLELTDRYLKVIGRGENTRRLKLPWEHITRAVERPREVEFFVENARMLTVPKRCIEDMEQLRAVVDAHMVK